VTQAYTFTLHQWRSHGKLVYLLHVWEKNRFDGDQEMFEALRVWYYGDPTSRQAHQDWKNGLRDKPDLYNGHRHLWEWWCSLSDQLQKRRLDVYRSFAARIARDGYKQVIVEEFDLRAVAERRKAEDAFKPIDPVRDVPSHQDEAARRQRTEASVSTLRGAIENVCGREGIVLHKIPAAWTTKSCAVCGDMERRNTAKEIVVRCSCNYAPGASVHCWDQDHNACKNLLDAVLPLGWNEPGMELAAV